ncbi:DNA methylase [Acinetobacter nosocomialis]|uniref:DNA methylase n=1 Tax=Acinetobacter nosocomialis TaxID=106654 RepID=UPI00126A1AD5|nr:DNA methylase [Acinetobacter nosocomialis]
MNSDLQSLEILNPKLKTSKKGQQSDSALFSYYAGFSENFTINLLDQISPKDKNLTIFDPWNGSGTTTFSAYKLGHDAIGSDLNPVMLIVAKARLINNLDLGSLEAICQTIIHNSFSNKTRVYIENDPLNIWFTEKSTHLLRKIENAINKNFINFDHYSDLTKKSTINKLSTTGAFIYVILFKTVKTLLKSFIPSNPTWVKKPKSNEEKITVSKNEIVNTFFKVLHNTIKAHSFHQYSNPKEATINLKIDNSTSLLQDSSSVDIVLTSPPYCTRIDYAVATSIEIAIIRVSDIKQLRDKLIGTSTIKKEIIEPDILWGGNCNSFLTQVKNHPSVASSSYYYKNHLQYFNDLYKSIGHISRVLKNDGIFIPVVQNSFYKVIENNLAQTVIEMSQQHGLTLVRDTKFSAKINMSSINTKSNKYISQKDIFESVLFFKNSRKQ